MISKRYVLPFSGTIKSTNPVSGDENDPIRPVGVAEFVRSYPWPDGVISNVKMLLIDINVERREAVVEVIADEFFFTAFDQFVANKTPEEILNAMNSL